MFFGTILMTIFLVGLIDQDSFVQDDFPGLSDVKPNATTPASHPVGCEGIRVRHLILVVYCFKTFIFLTSIIQLIITEGVIIHSDYHNNANLRKVKEKLENPSNRINKSHFFSRLARWNPKDSLLQNSHRDVSL